MIDGVLLRRAESEDAWAMGVIETACWRVGYAGCFQPVLEGLDESIRVKRWQRFSDVAVKHGLLRIWKVGFWLHGSRFAQRRVGRRARCPGRTPRSCLWPRRIGLGAWGANF